MFYQTDSAHELQIMFIFSIITIIIIIITIKTDCSTNQTAIMFSNFSFKMQWKRFKKNQHYLKLYIQSVMYIKNAFILGESLPYILGTSSSFLVGYMYAGPKTWKRNVIVRAQKTPDARQNDLHHKVVYYILSTFIFSI
jgi:hypothetical protein